MKKLLISLAFIALVIDAQAQNVIYTDNFESYTVGGYLAVQNNTWTTWSNLPGGAEDALISSAQARSGIKSVLVQGASDLVLKMGNKTTGVYAVEFYYFIPTGKGGYFNFQHYQTPGTEWANEVYFANNGTGYMNAGGNNVATFTYTQNQWVYNKTIIDLDADWAKYYLNGTLIFEWKWSLKANGGQGINQLGGLNVYAGAPTGQTAQYYFDDITWSQVLPPIYSDNFESYAVGGKLAQLSTWWTTWSNQPGGVEDAPISADQAHSPTKSVLVQGASDLVLPMGNKINGEYLVDFWYFIPTGFGGYFNFQHYQAPGVEWAFEVYFANNGTGYVNAGGNNVATFTYVNNQWIYIKNIINLNTDWGKFYLNDQLIHGWKWSLKANGGQGVNQLGGLNIYAGAPTGQTAKFYMDDISWVELSASTVPVVVVAPLQLTQALAGGTSAAQTLSVSNTGGLNLDYNLEINYGPGANTQLPPPGGTSSIKNIILELSQDPAPVAGGEGPATKDVTLNYDGINNSGIGLTNPNQWEVAARFPHSMVRPYAGMQLYRIDVYINHVDNCTFKARVYGESTSYASGAIKVDQPFTTPMPQWTTINLTTPVLVTGEDLWVGYWINQTLGSIYPAGTDAGPANPNGDFIRTGTALGWGHLSDTPTLNYNWNIRAILQGTAISQWLSVSPVSGTLAPGLQQNITVTFNSANLAIGSYEAVVKVKSNDMANPTVPVTVMLSVMVGVNELGENNAVMIYPNPAKDYMHIQANHNLYDIRLFNLLGQQVVSYRLSDQSSTINISSLVPGMYLLQINTEAGMVTRKLMIGQ
ncbi:MAG: T9SS type A sorting domain-containing protein [Bacteroidales bacterium]|nr:T9SS type A sorting domain-containing protein [Bacteroidales bacterium]